MNSFLETNESLLSVGREERIQNSLLIYEQTYIRGMHLIPRMGLSGGWVFLPILVAGEGFEPTTSGL